MVETDWREILNFSQRELVLADKDKLCESLSWMEADDIELNFTDLKTLFRLAQDILKFKSEQVNNLLGQLESSQRKPGKSRGKSSYVASPARSTDSVLETIAHQEELIKANKEILEQLYADIAELEGRKTQIEKDKNNVDKDSESSRDVLSEINAITELENEIAMKNRHIRKLLGDVKVLEEENIKLKEKLSIIKDKLTEATQLIENLTEKLSAINNENNQLKEIVGKTERAKSQLSVEIESLRKEIFKNDSKRENVYEEIKAKVHHWKNVARLKESEIKALSSENIRLKEDLIQASHTAVSPKVKRSHAEELKIKELQDKLLEASNEILQSANLIEVLKTENMKLKNSMDVIPDYSISDTKNESDDGKERILINKLKRKIKNLTATLHGAEEMVANREKELIEVTSQMQMLKSDKGINALLEGLKNKKRKLKFQDQGIKSLVHEVNTLNQFVNDLQLENETMRQKLHIPADKIISTQGILKSYREIEATNFQLKKQLQQVENKIVNMQVDNRYLSLKASKLTKLLMEMGCSHKRIEELSSVGDDEVMPTDGGGEASTVLAKQREKAKNYSQEAEMQAITEENEGLRKGLQEILEFLKDNSTTSSGVLALQCPSLETILHSMEARHAAGWFAPHMTAVMELRAAIGGKDALLTALHQARKETFEVMTQLSQESQKSLELEQKLNEMEFKNKSQNEAGKNATNILTGQFGTWMTEKEQNNIDFRDRNQIENIIAKGKIIYEDQLKNGLVYFHNKFKALFNKMTSIAIEAADEQNKWSIQEEQYKARIENFEAKLCQNDEDEDASDGLVNVPSIHFLSRKCSYLEESYKYIRTLNENMKNEYLESKRDAMIVASEYETQIQNLILSVVSLTDKLRCSISMELFWKQNEALNEITTKYRNVIDKGVNKQDEFTNLFERLENDSREVIASFQRELLSNERKVDDKNTKNVSKILEQTIFTQQIQQLCFELENKNKQIERLETKNKELQETQSKLIDSNLASNTKEEIDLIKEQLEKLAEENRILKEKCQHIDSQLDIALLQLQDKQQRQISHDMEINMLRHQILDLQSTSDSKAIVARLSGEVLLAHLQASESHKKIERLSFALNKEKQLKVDAEEMLRARQKIFEVYDLRYESKLRYMHEVMQILRQQYQGCLPLTSVEEYLNSLEELSRKSYDVNEKLDEIEDLRSSLMTKHSVFNQILDLSKPKCLEDEDSCPHKLQNILSEGIHTRELTHCMKKLETLEQSRKEILKRCNNLEKTLVLVNQGFEKRTSGAVAGINSSLNANILSMELEDVQSDDEPSLNSSQTITLPKPLVLNPPKNNEDMTKILKVDSADILVHPPIRTSQNYQQPELVSVFVQTSGVEPHKMHKQVQTEEDETISSLRCTIDSLERHVDKKNKEFSEAMKLAHQRTEDIILLNTEKINLETTIQNLKDTNYQKDKLNEWLRSSIDGLRTQIDKYENIHDAKKIKTKEVSDEENNSLLLAFKQLESDKNAIVANYKTLLNNEREQYSKSVKELHVKIMELQTQLDKRESDSNSANSDPMKEAIGKYTLKIAELEDKCFKTQSELDGCRQELTTYQSEVGRWKDLATERLTKMEQLNFQLEERHCQEVNSYKVENDHWLSQLNDSQREHMELRSRLTEQKASYVKLLNEKDSQIEHLRSVVHGMKTQIMNMQTMISITDPSFDLSAIVEVEEVSDTASQHGSDRYELKFDSTVDLHDDAMRMHATSTTIWQEPLIERLRQEKQMTSKQNALLRRQIKALAARERRARLDAQNLKNQVFRISTTGNKVVTAESASLHSKIASLQAQLMSARRDSHSTVALWDKWKRAQQASERWQSRYEDKLQEVKKLECNLNLAKSTVARLEKEKRVLLSRLNEVKNEKQSIVEKQDGEHSEKARSEGEASARAFSESPVSARALLERVQAQQRRIAALEVAEKGNEHLVSEYEKALAEVASLKGQVLKLESTLLETQIRSPLKSSRDAQPELDYWKSYCEMLKEENVQLTLKVNSVEAAPATAHRHRVNDLEQTVLTLRGLVSKLQAEQKSTVANKRPESRPSSGRSATEKNRSEVEPHRLEIANLRRSLHDKDLLLEKSKEMLKIAAEREDDLLRENASLRRRVDELSHHKGGFSSA